MSKKSTRGVGKLGEEIAVRFFRERGFTILGKNYQKPYGEIDIIASKDERIHFVEVKTISMRNGVVYARPEEHMDSWKIHRFKRIVDVYLHSHSLLECEWQYDLLAITLDVEGKIARCRHHKHIY